MVVGSAWALYKNPENIESYTRAVEHGSNLDLTLSTAAAAGRHQLDANGESAADTAAASGVEDTSPAFCFSYFVAWLLVILLLLLVGGLAIAAVRTDGELVLYDVQVKKLVSAGSSSARVVKLELFVAAAGLSGIGDVRRLTSCRPRHRVRVNLAIVALGAGPHYRHQADLIRSLEQAHAILFAVAEHQVHAYVRVQHLSICTPQARPGEGPTAGQDV